MQGITTVVKSIAMSTKNWVINTKERLSTWICHPVKDDVWFGGLVIQKQPGLYKIL